MVAVIERQQLDIDDDNQAALTISSTNELSKHVKKTTQLFLSSPIINHAPGVGINQLVDEAASLFSIMGELKQARICDNIAALQQKLITQVEQFQSAILNQNDNFDCLSEYNALCCYGICATLDSIIFSAGWGGEEKWRPYSLVTHFVANPPSETNFFIILERLVRDPNIYIDVIEFMYLCLNFGLKFYSKTKSPEFDQEQIDQIIQSLYKRIRIHRGNFNKNLSPFPIRSQHNLIQSSSGWLNIITLKNKLQRFIKVPFKKSGQSDESSIINQISLLKDQFFDINELLNQATIKKQNKKFKLSQLPWFLVVGSSEAAKTSLLKNSNVNFLFAKELSQIATKYKTTDDIANWWVTSENVLIELSENLFPSAIGAKNNSQIMLNELFNSIKATRRKNYLNGVVFAIGLSEIMFDEGRADLAIRAKNFIKEINNKFKQNIPLYFVINKCELLPGFLDFFSDNSQEELLQAWGITLPDSSNVNSIAELFNDRFDALIKRLNTQLIWRLQKEKILLTKFKIKNFPIQVERLKQSLLSFIHEFELDLSLKGVYLTSSEQINSAEDEKNYPQIISGKGIQRAFQILHNPEIPTRGYFIKQFIMQGLA